MSQPASFQPRIALRERSMTQIMDLSITVLRAWWKQLAMPMLLGSLPFFLLNLYYGRLVETLAGASADNEEYFMRIYLFGLLLVLESPWISAPTEIALGALVFNQKMKARQILGRLISGLPKMILFQFVLRGLITMFGITILAIPLALGFINEVIFLERVSWRRILRRVKSLNSGSDQFAFSLAALSFQMLFVGCGWYALSVFLSIMEKSSVWIDPDAAFFSDWKFHLLTIISIQFFAIARFLFYIDVRIRSEGWDLENQVRLIVTDRQVVSVGRERPTA